jgi:hypothetical protein
MSLKIHLHVLVFLIAIMAFSGLSNANEIAVDYDGPTIIDLNSDAATVIVGNPEHAQVMLDNPRRLLVNAGQPGMTRLMVLDKNGQVILNRNMVVGNGGGHNGSMIRIRNACINGGEGCAENRVYYCAEGQRCNTMMMPTAPATGGAGMPINSPGPIVPPAAPQGE